MTGKGTSRCFEMVANPVGRDKAVLWEGAGAAKQVQAASILLLAAEGFCLYF